MLAHPILLRGGIHHPTRTLSTHAFRSHTCGELRVDDIGKEIKLSGWVDAIRSFGPMTFVSIRDRHGTTQLVFGKDNHVDSANLLKPETVIRVTGQVPDLPTSYHKNPLNHDQVRGRPIDMVNANMGTGAVEVVVDSVDTLNTTSPLPLQVSTGSEVANEDTRLRHRYLDLRRPALQQNLALRSNVSMTARNYLCQLGFLEIETPTLFKSTPEGAREFLVPTRSKNQFYALTQSPQQYKQVRLFFLVASWGMVKSIWKCANVSLDHAFPIMSYSDAMDRFGVDKPDTRFGLELKDLSDIIPVDVFGSSTTTSPSTDVVRAINVKQLAKGGFSRKDMADLEALAKRLSVDGRGVYAVKIEDNIKWKSSVAKKLSAAQLDQVNHRLDVEDDDVLLLTCGSYANVCTLLGRMRLQTSQLLYARGQLQEELDPFKYNHLWIVDFPMFEMDNDGLSATHHPFTAPREDDLAKLKALLATGKNAWEDPAMQNELLTIKAQHMDLVCNGWELGGGSIRLHSMELQQSVLQQVLNLPDIQVRATHQLPPVDIKMAKESTKKIKTSTVADVVSRDYTINLHKRLHGATFKKKAPKAVREIKKFAQKAMGTADVRIDSKLNKFVWSQGVRNIPYRVRVRLSRKRNEDEDAKEKLYTLVQHVQVSTYKGLSTENVEE
ncbi:hypothetical protein DYB25_003738 [Aphanomyces astaci]|uniref:Aminoacyl-transfer RNA synthetases class-II family profile domain-containing protein n=3 Tax=Aphanomyces astaci TaxID=112090 RepID=A0A397EBQ7_APHAT|nr:hypothetical protein DYB25_003738 [Aphanomyces astaci]RHY79769.1 hypothetical protein DYB31_000113 [Aphanomyces astaci]